MTYCNIDTEEIKRFTEIHTFQNLKEWFFELIDSYKKWADFQWEWRKKRQESIWQLSFPFTYRKGQKKLAQDVYRTILRKKILFIQAPTGVGKTITTLFPAVKAVGENLGEKIFYLTAKTVTGNVAWDTFSIFKAHGYQGKIIGITAKEKLCLASEMDCNPVNCPYAKGHYDRVNDAVFELLTSEDDFTRDVLVQYAEKWQVCPFEMCLDLSLWVDVIICDYNYVFDPNVALKRFFADSVKGDYIFLVDEAHNLVERGREMYSASLLKEQFLNMKKIMKLYSKRVVKEINACNRILLQLKRECETYQAYENLNTLIISCMRLADQLDKLLEKNIQIVEQKEVNEFYFALRHFLNIYELVDEKYVCYGQHLADGSFQIKLYCVDPSENLQRCLEKGNSTIFFSATFLPISYYKSLLSTKSDNYAVYAQTAFSKEQSLVTIAKDVSTRYTRRNQSEFEKIAQYILITIKAKQGNYMIFFPSYQLMEEVYIAFLSLEGEKIADCILQKSNMKEEEREDFLNEFSKKRNKSLAGFCVMGGIFGEGIDLKNEQLIGVLIVGNGMPQISNERDILKKYYDKKNHQGFDYAFRYPGMNKVFQAAGRVIRTTEDVGVIILLEERFLQKEYIQMFPHEWENYQVCDQEQLKIQLDTFWKQKKTD
ncbi:MAG: ATP-dependent DNA helicase [Lachnospiraceae bacterium]